MCFTNALVTIILKIQFNPTRSIYILRKEHHWKQRPLRSYLLLARGIGCLLLPLVSCNGIGIQVFAAGWFILSLSHNSKTNYNNDYSGLSFSFRALAALNPAAVEALICIFSPVLGFRPSLAFRARGSKVPNPAKLTFLPSARFCDGDKKETNVVSPTVLQCIRSYSAVHSTWMFATSSIPFSTTIEF